MSVGARALRTLEVARRVSDVLAQEGIPHGLVGSVALAVHGFVRATRDLDVGVLVPPAPRMTALAEALRREGLTAEWSPPAPDDELGGVLTVVGAEFDPIKVVNFFNPPRAPSRLVGEALATAAPTGGFPFPVVDLPHLVALKLATGAFRDEVDVGDLLEARADAPVEELRALCSEHGLGPALERVLGRLGRG